MSFMEIFQPGLKHLREERYRRQMDVAYPTNGGNPPIEIDLDAGTATIVVRVPAARAGSTSRPTSADASPDDLPHWSGHSASRTSSEPACAVALTCRGRPGVCRPGSTRSR